MADHRNEKWIYLSYEMDPDTPSYGNGDSLSIKPANQINAGDSCNTAVWTFPNHLGTHIDFPKHFYEDGESFSSMPPKFFIADKVGFIDISPVNIGEIITPDHIASHKVDSDVEILLIKTGFCEFRNKNVYWRGNPGMDPDLSGYLRSRFLDLRMIGFDSISLSSYANRGIGRQAHRSFLAGENPLLIVEDMDLSSISREINIIQIIVAPLPVRDADGAPCNIIAKIHNSI